MRTTAHTFAAASAEDVTRTKKIFIAKRTYAGRYTFAGKKAFTAGPREQSMRESVSHI